MINIVSKQQFESIDQFEFELEEGKNTIGTGSFGVVKLALHKGSNRLYALKIIDLKKVATEAQLKIIQREIELHSGLDHPHIIKIWDTLLRDNVVYMIMECAERGNLFYHQNSKSRFSEPEAFQYFYQCCLAVDYLHRNNIMHRDIKPENLLLDHSLNLKLCDFGWSAVDIHAKRTTFCGTYEYMAPEMILKYQYDYRIDIWGLGILLFEMLHGFAPFRGSSLEAVSTEIQKGQYHIHPNLSEDLKNLIRLILQFDPAKRPSIKEVFQHPWVLRMKQTINSYLKKTELTLATIVPLKLNKMKLEECPPGIIKKKTHRKAESVSHMPSSRPSVSKDKKSIQINFEINNYELVQSLNPTKKLTSRCKTMTEESIKRLMTGNQLFNKGMTQSHQSPQTKKPKKTSTASKTKVQHARFNTEFSETIKAQRKKKSIDDAVCKLSKKYLAHVRGPSKG